MKKVGIDRNGQYFDLNTGESVEVSFEAEPPFDRYTGEDVMIVFADPGDDTILEITDDIKDALIAIFGNSNQIPPARQVPNEIRTTVAVSPRVPVYQEPQNSGGLFGGELKIKAEYALLIVGGLILFTLGKSKGK